MSSTGSKDVPSLEPTGSNVKEKRQDTSEQQFGSKIGERWHTHQTIPKPAGEEESPEDEVQYQVQQIAKKLSMLGSVLNQETTQEGIIANKLKNTQEEAKELNEGQYPAIKILSKKINDIEFRLNDMENSLLENKVKTIKKLNEKWTDHEKSIWAAVYSEKYNKLVTCGDDGIIKVWDISTMKQLYSLTGHTGGITKSISLRDGNVATGGEDGTIRIWDINNGICVQLLDDNRGSWVRSLLEISDDTILSGFENKSLVLWKKNFLHNTNQNYLSIMTILRVEQVACQVLLKLPDERLVASSDANINIYSIEEPFTLNLTAILSGHEDSVRDIKYLKQTDNLLSCSNDKTCRLWSILLGNCIRVFKGHKDFIQTIMVLSDNLFISSSHSIRLWRVDNGENVDKISFHNKEASTVHCLIDVGNRRFLSTGQDRVLTFWAY